MADKASETKEVASTVEEVDKTKVVDETPAADEESKSENGNSKENGDAVDNDKEKEDTEKNGADDETDKICRLKRKSAGGDAAVEEKPTEAATPEKKAKLDETVEAESNGEAEVAA